MPSYGQPTAAESPAANGQPSRTPAADGQPKSASRSSKGGGRCLRFRIFSSIDRSLPRWCRWSSRLTGAIALIWLPIAQYPPITPPSIQVSIVYPGASAQVVADTVAAPIEQQVNGVEGMLYMSSQMGNDGSYSLSVTFDVGTDLNTALVMVQNRVTLAMPHVAHAGAKPGNHDPQADARHLDDRQLLFRRTAATTTSI